MPKTWLTKAGPPLLLLEVSPAILTIDGKPEFDLAEDIPLVADLEEMESGWFNSKSKGMRWKGKYSQ